MPTRSHLALGSAEQVTLEQLRDHGPKPYLRELAAVLSAIAHGASIRRAAQQAGGLKPTTPIRSVPGSPATAKWGSRG